MSSPIRLAREYTLVVIVMAAITAALTYPQIATMSSQVGAHYDALFSIWRLGWFAHQLPRDPLHLFDANIFYPARNTFAYSDAILFENVLAAPFLWRGGNPVVVHNFLILLSFVTAGTAMYVWLVSRNLSRAVALLGGLMFTFQPYRFAHFPQLELLWTCWIPVAFLSVERLFDTPRPRHGVLLGLAVALQIWSCLYYGVFLISALAVLAIVFLLGKRAVDWRPLLISGAVAVATTILLCLPYALPYIESHDIRKQRAGEVVTWSASPENYISTTAESWLYRHPVPPPLSPFEGVLFPGFLTLLLAAVGAVGLRDRRTVAYVVLAIVAFDLSLGVNGVSYHLLRRSFFAYAGLRVPARQFVIVSAALSLLAAQGAARLLRAARSGTRSIAVVALGLVVLLESTSVPLPLNKIPDIPELYRRLGDLPRGAVIEWPVPRADALGLTRVPDYMYFSTVHWQPLTVGYSGSYPDEYIVLLEHMVTFPSRGSLLYLQQRGVKYLVLHSELDPLRYLDVSKQLSNRPEVQFMFADRTTTEEIALYTIRTLR